jgi:hypothetical protein
MYLNVIMIHFILFTGHMIDKPGRPNPRFPPSLEEKAKQAIRQRLEKVLAEAGTGITAISDLKGIAGGACGGDILFHEACLELAISSELYLAIPVEEFEKTSVAFAGSDWIRRYRRLTKKLPVHILLPEAVEEIWEQANRWMLQDALSNGGENMTLVALWDHQKGDGKGGAEHMANMAKEKNAKIEIIDITELFA